MEKITNSSLKAFLAIHRGKESAVWDSGDGSVKGFGVRVKPSGAASFIIQYRNEHGRSRRLTLGSVGRLTVEQARKEAKQKLADVDRGEDPADKRAAARNALTVAQLCDEYLAAAKGRLKPSTLANDGGRINCHIKPLLGARIVETLKPSDVERFVAAVIAGKTAKERPRAAGKARAGNVARGGEGAASRAVGLLRTILQRAVKDDILARNPASGVARPKDEAREQPFSFERVSAVGKAMRAREAAEIEELGKTREHTPVAIRTARFLILTGCRKTEALTLQWGDVDFAAGCLRLRDSKTGKQMRPMGRAALDHLASFKPRGAAAGDYVFPGTSRAGHYIGFARAWERIATAAKVPEITPHGLRHWFASAAAEMNYSDFVIGGMLGHAKRGVTGRYANAPDSALLMAADRVSQKLLDALDGNRTGKVVQIGRQ